MDFLGAWLTTFFIHMPVPPPEDFQWILGPDVADSVGRAVARGVRMSAFAFGFLT